MTKAKPKPAETPPVENDPDGDFRDEVLPDNTTPPVGKP